MFKTPVIEQDYRQRTEAFLQDMRDQTNPRDLLRWARSQIKQANGRRADLDYIPSFVGWTSAKMPTGGYVEPNEGTPYVHLIWSKAGNRWGLIVGPPEFTLTATASDHLIQWVPGIYAWHEIKPEQPRTFPT